MAHPHSSTDDPSLAADGRASDPDRDAADPLARLRPLPSGSAWDRVVEVRDAVVASPGRSAAIVVAAVAVAVTGWWFLRPPAAPLEGAVPVATSGAAGAPSTTGGGGSVTSAGPNRSTSTTEGALVVQAAGAVARGGVFRLPPGSRVDDLIRAAGGLVSDADADRVNLAAPLTDGERVWIPRRGEAAAPEVVAGAGGGSGATAIAGGAGPGSAAAGRTVPPAMVDLNTATATELEALPGVGPATAAAIVAYRSEHGSFSSVDDLLEVRGIGDAKLEQIRPAATV